MGDECFFVVSTIWKFFDLRVGDGDAFHARRRADGLRDDAVEKRLDEGAFLVLRGTVVFAVSGDDAAGIRVIGFFAPTRYASGDFDSGNGVTAADFDFVDGK